MANNGAHRSRSPLGEDASFSPGSGSETGRTGAGPFSSIHPDASARPTSSSEAQASKRCVAALDVGTTGVRCLLYDKQGTALANVYARVNEIQEKPGWSEVDPWDLWEQCRTVIAGALPESGIQASEVSSIGMATLRSSFVTFSRKTGKPCHRIITWQDTRAADIAKR